MASTLAFPPNFQKKSQEFIPNWNYTKCSSNFNTTRTCLPVPIRSPINNFPRHLNLFSFKKKKREKRNLSNRRTSLAWIPPAPPRVKNLSCIVLIYHRLDLSSNSNWNVSWSDISSWLAVTSTPEKLMKKKVVHHHQNSRCGTPNSWIFWLRFLRIASKFESIYHSIEHTEREAFSYLGTLHGL